MSERPAGRRSIIKTDGPGLQMQRRRRVVMVVGIVVALVVLAAAWVLLHAGELLPVAKG